ncbi:MAG: AAA family ATPase [bacterium]|nr:AAA family ATPase [bacterium]
MRRFWSYGPVDTAEHYYADRQKLIEKIYTGLTGNNPLKNGNCITVWAPRQCGKSWLMIQVYQRLKKDPLFDVVPISLERVKDETDVKQILRIVAKKIGERLGKSFDNIDSHEKFQEIFRKDVLDKPLILILDEFDALTEEAINTFVSAFRNTYIERRYEADKNSAKKSYLLHGVALVGVRSVLGIENAKGSPFNVQQSLQVSNLTFDEVQKMFSWYEKESDQKVEPAVIKRLYYETCGQPGVTCWFGELLTDSYNTNKSKPITVKQFDEVYTAALKVLPNNTILNIVSKAKQNPYKETVLELFKTDIKMEFSYGNPELNFLYMNGVIDKEEVNRTEYYVKFTSPFVQKSLFNYFSTELFRDMGQLVEPFESLEDTVTEKTVDIRNLARRYQQYLAKNKDWLLEDVPRRKDLRIYEAVFHFNFYSYIKAFLKPRGGRVVPEFPTGNGKIDLLIFYKEQRYGIELKSYSTEWGYNEALAQAAGYGNQLGLAEIFLVFFVENIDSKSRQKYEADFKDETSGVTVKPIFIHAGMLTQPLKR